MFKIILVALMLIFVAIGGYEVVYVFKGITQTHNQQIERALKEME